MIPSRPTRIRGEAAPEALRSKVGFAEGRRKGGLPPSELIEKGGLTGVQPPKNI